MKYLIPGEDGFVAVSKKPRAMYRSHPDSDTRWAVCFTNELVSCFGVGATAREAYEDAYKVAARTPAFHGRRL
jgi:hypothetical protein